jgi:hypothetical protein
MPEARFAGDLQSRHMHPSRRVLHEERRGRWFLQQVASPIIARASVPAPQGRRRRRSITTSPRLRHRDPVGAAEGFIQLVGDEHHGATRLGERARPRQAVPPASLGRQHPVGSSSRRYPRIARQRLDDFAVAGGAPTGRVPARARGSSGRLSRSVSRGQRAPPALAGPHMPAGEQRHIFRHRQCGIST